MENKMEQLDTIIENGLVVTEDVTQIMNVGIKDQSIAYIGQDVLEAKKKVNAENLYVLPGGVDPHVHVDQPSGPDVEMADNFQRNLKSYIVIKSYPLGLYYKHLYYPEYVH